MEWRRRLTVCNNLTLSSAEVSEDRGKGEYQGKGEVRVRGYVRVRG